MQRIPRVDCSAFSFLPLCPDPRCGWRGLPRSTRDAAAQVADRHAVALHGDARARDAIRQRDSRLSAAR